MEKAPILSGSVLFLFLDSSRAPVIIIYLSFSDAAFGLKAFYVYVFAFFFCVFLLQIPTHHLQSVQFKYKMIYYHL